MGSSERRRESPDAARLGAYELRGHLGTGGMGEVFLAWDGRLHRHVAIKRIRPDLQTTRERRERFLREARAAAALNHPAIVQVYDILESETGDSIVMEYVEGRSLARRLAEGAIGVAEAVRLARQVADGLARAHALGFIHRDLKAENVMVTPDGQVKILDFGLAKQIAMEAMGEADESLTREGMVLGTLRTMSPEQAGGDEVDARSDLYSLGVLLYEMLTGRPPFQGGNAVQIHRRVLTERPAPPCAVRPELPAELSAMVAALLEKDPARRPRSAAEVIRALERVSSLDGLDELGPAPVAQPLQLSSDASTVVPQGPRSSPVARKNRRRLLLALLALGAAAAAAVLLTDLPTRKPVRVLVLAPERSGAGAGDLGLVAIGVREAALSALFALRGVEVLDPFPHDAGSGREDVSRVYADEILGTQISCPGGETCRVSFRRFRGDRIVGLTQPFFVSKRAEDALDLAAAVRTHLPAAFPDHRPRSAAALDVRPADYAAFIRLRERAESGEVLGAPELAVLESILRSSPRLSGAYVLAADVARALQGPHFLQRSLDLAGRAHELAPWDPRPLANKVFVELDAGRLDEAETTLAQLERLTPGDISVWKSRARLLARQGRPHEALAVWARIVGRRPTWQNLYNLADLEIGAGRIGEARRHLDQLLAVSPDNDWGLAKLAELELQSGDPGRAEALYRRLLQSGPPLGLYRNNLGLALHLQGRFAAATESYRRALDLDPGNQLTRINLADSLFSAGRAAEARGLYRDVLGELVEAERGGAKPGIAERLFAARCQVRMGQPREAFETVQQTLAEPGAQRAEWLYHGARVAALVGQRLDAIEYAERALALHLSPRWFQDPAFDPVRDDLQPLLAARSSP